VALIIGNMLIAFYDWWYILILFGKDVKDRTDKETTFFRYIDLATSWILELESVGPGLGAENREREFILLQTTLFLPILFPFQQLM
jgi:hypothetical protein